VALKEPVPLPDPGADPALLEWANRLVVWLSVLLFQESTLEEDLVFGGADMANRAFGFEGAITGPDTAVVLTAPTGAKKKIVVWMSVTSDEPTGGTPQNVRVYKKVGANEYDIWSAAIKQNTDLTNSGQGVLVLDAADESIEIEVDGTAEIHWNGSYLDVD
jgi:hypothetical protein